MTVSLHEGVVMSSKITNTQSPNTPLSPYTGHLRLDLQ